ncbi:unnamed protein product (macronuclear) [Paramecium tetraurelia]|uniref:RING-type domain-containing protein n=1 Tax=Paramecium tetraurelia TaxID=5888 RepID=A0EIS0_PARTE|nr:uncharacterized protein GSPATT00027540001 [Paramecium tetraurelia]CAK95211.1 unnamed protein product [Paramecium tetraurelia]|eukprot:XP_001462584.1 hypothetical protein (macronuclear) [Paramecium tetraurelia strain d4-2]
MQNQITYGQILSHQIQTQGNKNVSENGQVQQDIKNKPLNQSTTSNNKNIKIISETELNDKSHYNQTSQQQNNTQQSLQQQIIIKQDSFQKNSTDQNKFELESRIIISSQFFQDDLTENIAFTQVLSCSYCLGSLASVNISLPCFHLYHQECFNEIINNFLSRGYSMVFQCKCNISIPYKTLIRLAQKDSKLVEELLIQQQAWIISSAPVTIQNQISGYKKSINNIKTFIKEQINHYQAGLIKIDL